MKFQNLNTCLSQGNGFSFDIPSRAKGNQMYVAELDRIVLKDTISKRPFSSTQVSDCGIATPAMITQGITKGSGSGKRGETQRWVEVK